MGKSICKNQWCRAPYSFEGDMPPGECNKCKNTPGVTWIEKKYTDPKDGTYEYDISQYHVNNKTKYFGR